MLEFACGCDDGARGVVVARTIGAECGGIHPLDGLQSSRNRPAKRVAGPLGVFEEFLNARGGFILIHENFLRYDAALPVDVAGRETGVHVDVAEDIADSGKKLGSSGGVVAGALLGSEGVHVSADALDLLHDASRGAALGAFEKHVLNEVRDAIQARRLVASPDRGPDAHGGGFGMRHFAGGDAEAVGKFSEARLIRHGMGCVFSKRW